MAYYPSRQAWETVAPADAGFDPARLAAAVQFSIDHVSHTLARTISPRQLVCHPAHSTDGVRRGCRA